MKFTPFNQFGQIIGCFNPAISIIQYYLAAMKHINGVLDDKILSGKHLTWNTRSMCHKLWNFIGTIMKLLTIASAIHLALTRMTQFWLNNRRIPAYSIFGYSALVWSWKFLHRGIWIWLKWNKILRKSDTFLKRLMNEVSFCMLTRNFSSEGRCRVLISVGISRPPRNSSML